MGTGRRHFGKNRGLCLSVVLTAGILGMFSFQIMVWAAPGNAGREEEVLPEREAEDILPADRTESGETTAREQQKEERDAAAGMTETMGKAQKAVPQAGKGDQEQQSPLIAIDPGHGGMDCGCMGKTASEKDINLQIARQLEKKLEEKGYRVLLLREKDEMQDKLDRVEIANSYQADLYVSIHQNTYEGKEKSVGGIETWYDGADATRDNRRLALLIHRETVKSSGARGRGVIDSSDLYVVSRTLMPACLIETGFLSNPQEEKLLASGTYQEKLAEGIARGIELYFHPGTMYLPFMEVSQGFAAGM